MNSPLVISMEGLGPWSHSKLKMLKKCPFNFYLKYVRKMKGQEVKSPETLLGSAAHRILELFITGKSLHDSFKETKVEFSDSIDSKLWVERVETLELSIEAFKRKLDDFDKKHKIKKVMTELRLGITRDFQPSTFFAKDVFFRGIIDLALHLECNDVVFWDHKKGGSSTYGIKVYNDQLNTYKVLFHHGVEKIAGASAGINFIEEGTTKLGDYHSVEDIEGKLKNDLLFSIDTAVHQLEEIGFFKHIAGSHCQWCEFNKECKAGNLKELELGTKALICSKQ